MNIISVRLTTKGIKVVYEDGETLKTMTCQEDPKESFVETLAKVKEIFLGHMQFQNQSKSLNCTGIDTKVDKDGVILYKVFAELRRPGWDSLRWRLASGWMCFPPEVDFWEKPNKPKDFPYFITAEEEQVFEEMLDEAEKYLNGERFDSQPGLFDGNDAEEE